MKRDAVGDKIERVGFKGQGVCIGGLEFDVRDAALACVFLRGVEHLLCEVSGGVNSTNRPKLAPWAWTAFVACLSTFAPNCCWIS